VRKLMNELNKAADEAYAVTFGTDPTPAELLALWCNYAEERILGLEGTVSISRWQKEPVNEMTVCATCGDTSVTVEASVADVGTMDFEHWPIRLTVVEGGE